MRIFFLLFFLTGFSVYAEAQTTSDTSKTGENYSIQVDPVFPGGDSAFSAFVQANLIYPSDARWRSKQGYVGVRFTVEADGSLSEIKVYKKLTHSCDQAAMNAVAKSPKWIPGELYGKPCRARKVVMVRFIL